MKPIHDRITQSAAANAPGLATAATSHQTSSTIPATRACPVMRVMIEAIAAMGSL